MASLVIRGGCGGDACCPAAGETGRVTGGLELPGAHPGPVAACVNKVELKLMYNQKVQNTTFLKRRTVA